MLDSSPEISGEGTFLQGLRPHHCRLPASIFHSTALSLSRDPLELLGAGIDLCLWADSTPKRQFRASDRFLRQRWERGSGWVNRALGLILEATGGKKVASGMAGSIFEIPRPKKDFVELPLEIVAHLRRPRPEIAADERLLQLAGIAILFATHEGRPLVEQTHVETLIPDPAGILVEQGLDQANIDRLLGSLVEKNLARWTEEGLRLRTHRELRAEPSPPSQATRVPRTGQRWGASGAPTGRRIRSQIPDLNGPTAHSSEAPAKQGEKKDRTACLAYWIRLPYGLSERLGIKHVPLVSAVSAFATDIELARWKEGRPTALASEIAGRLSAWQDAEPWHWPIVSHLLDLLTGLWLPPEEDLASLRCELVRHGDPGNASVRLSFFHPAFLRPQQGAMLSSPPAEPPVDRDVSLETVVVLATTLPLELVKPTSQGTNHQEDIDRAHHLLDRAMHIERPLLSPTLSRRERVRHQIAWRTFERACAEIEALLREERWKAIPPALTKLEASIEALLPSPTQAPEGTPVSSAPRADETHLEPPGGDPPEAVPAEPTDNIQPLPHADDKPLDVCPRQPACGSGLYVSPPLPSQNPTQALFCRTTRHRPTPTRYAFLRSWAGLWRLPRPPACGRDGRSLPGAQPSTRARDAPRACGIGPPAGPKETLIRKTSTGGEP